MGNFASFNKKREDFKKGQNPLNSTFASGLFENTLDFALLFSDENLAYEDLPQVKNDSEEKVTEKQKVFKSLEEFAQTKLEKEKVVEAIQPLDVAYSEAKEIFVVNDKVDDPYVVFLYDKRNGIEEFKSSESDILLENMIKAMKIPESQYQLACVVEKNIDTWKQVLKNIKPKFIFTIGATATKQLLGSSSKLSKIHGHEIHKSIESDGELLYNTTIVPLFHPDFLILNPNMKRTTWDDMKKIMEHWI